MRKIVSAIGLCLLMASCAKEKPKGNLQITGNIEGLKKGTLYIKHIKDTSLVAIDTINIDGDSHFESWLELPSPEMYYLVLDRGVTNSLDDKIPFFAEPGKMTIDTKLDQFFTQAKITGSKNQKLYEDYRKILARYTGKNLDLTEILLRKQHAKVTTGVDSITALQNRTTKSQYLFAVNFAKNNGKYEVAPYITLSDIPNIRLEYLEIIYKAMSPKVASSYYGKKLTAFYNERKKMGQ
ncbi:MAG: hypothetical protein CFE23_07710 [Flavobacterium sp. BFFFF1]|uniref:DUF4369 domain-containing protein n=1 Tax=unclassified Flavobacterium TaxID=196869 RepID=UPI000BCBDF91|nr:MULTISPECIES: DUF4369 domain-containing protein [unclassified Flavobacterium]OYU80876.1 MAG: hypothetical protein CFE23_07710 [Flavobacterium sp. BFFFF1]